MADVEPARQVAGSSSIKTAGTHRHRRQARSGSRRASIHDGAHAADPARPLGPKARLIVSRRRERSKGHAPPANNGDCQFDSNDGSLHLQLKATPLGLFVEWTTIAAVEVRLVQYLLLDSVDALHQWVDAEALRHEEPGLLQRLCRMGEEMLHGQGH